MLIKSSFSALIIALALGACSLQGAASFSFSEDELELNNGEELKVDMILASSENVDAVDAIVKFDPEMLSVERAAKGDIFEIYPIKVVDNDQGEIKISAASRDQFFTGEGTYALLTFKTLQTGETSVSYEFDKTTESHLDTDVMSQGTDLLSKVHDLKVTIK